MIADFHDRKKKKKSTQNGLHFLRLPEIVLHSVYRMKSNDADNNFPKIHLEQCKYEEMKSKEIKLNLLHFCTTKHKRDMSRLPQKYSCMMMINCFCGMVDQRRRSALFLAGNIRSSPLQISDLPRTRFQPAQNVSSGLVE